MGSTSRHVRVTRLSGVVLGVVLGSTGLAHASPVEASVTVSATPRVVLAWLADAPRTMRLSADVQSVAVVSDESNGCALVDVSTRGLFSPMRYRTRRCHRTDGFEERLVRSDDLDRNVTTWSVRATPAGTQIRLRVDVEPSFYVPEWIIDEATQESVDDMVKCLARALDRDAKASAPAAP